MARHSDRARGVGTRAALASILVAIAFGAVAQAGASAHATDAAGAGSDRSSAPVAMTTVVPTPQDGEAILEGFERADGWQVAAETLGGGSVERSAAVAAPEGGYAVRAATTNGGSASLWVGFRDAADDHTWAEPSGTRLWQRASVYLPSATVAALGPGEHLTLGRLWASADGDGWLVRVRQGGELFVVGRRDFDGRDFEFRVYGQVPRDRWFELELGLNSQDGPGVKRAFAFLIDGAFFGWYRQGRMKEEVYDRAEIGIVETNGAAPLVLFVDRWRRATTGFWPGGPDRRSTAEVQEQDFRTTSGEQWQIDWTTWANDPRLDPTRGLYSATDRLQSGRNLDRMPGLTTGWAEIEIDWPNGTPRNLRPDDGSYFGPMVGFRKDVNREQNLEVIPVGRGGGNVGLALEAWDGDGPTILAEWPLPAASIGGTHVPEPGDVIRVRWTQISASQLRVLASFYDASADRWHVDVISHYFASTVGSVDFNDSYHTGASVTIDSPDYSIRRFRIGTESTYPAP